MRKYASVYCQQDIKILRLGFNQFREGFMQDFHIDPFKFIYISFLAKEVFNQRFYYNHNLHMIGGVARNSVHMLCMTEDVLLHIPRNGTQRNHKVTSMQSLYTLLDG